MALFTGMSTSTLFEPVMLFLEVLAFIAALVPFKELWATLKDVVLRICRYISMIGFCVPHNASVQGLSLTPFQEALQSKETQGPSTANSVRCEAEQKVITRRGLCLTGTFHQVYRYYLCFFFTHFPHFLKNK